MPELPEVETIVRQLAPSLPGRRIVKARVFRPDVLREPPEHFLQGVTGATIRSVTRRGKNVVLFLSHSTVLVVNLGMTGRLLLLSPGASPGPSHVAVDLSLESGDSLLYADTRRFGRLTLYSAEEWGRESRRLGPEPLGKGLNAGVFHQRLRGSKAPLRSWLLDQKRLAGVGNIYACEALHQAGIHPLRTASSLDPRESGRLLRELRGVLRKAIVARGTTLRDYRTASGEEGGFLPFLQAYGREGKPCPRCESTIIRIVFSNRSAFLCPTCQPTPPSETEEG
jgi:formamidopyrimidine-DNA glycosylase